MIRRRIVEQGQAGRVEYPAFGPERTEKPRGFFRSSRLNERSRSDP
jgi:hypothetical protein